MIDVISVHKLETCFYRIKKCIYTKKCKQCITYNTKIFVTKKLVTHHVISLYFVSLKNNRWNNILNTITIIMHFN